MSQPTENQNLTIYNAIIDNYCELQKTAVRVLENRQSWSTPLSWWCEKLELSRGTLYNRIKSGAFTPSELKIILKYSR